MTKTFRLPSMVITIIAAFGGLMFTHAEPASAQTTAAVSVNASSPKSTIASEAFGLNTAIWDGHMLDSAIPGILTNAGVTALRFPGGSTSDTYNWQTDSIVPGQGGYANPNNTFDHFMGLVNNIGATPIITVNYGSSTTGVGGGDPQTAAAWVQYANVTKGYGVKYWEIGNEVYGNGEYGSKWETDLHTAHDPGTYGANVAQFASAMKAVDPSIKVGVVLTDPTQWPDGASPDWNTNVLAQCGSVIDFVIVHWYPQGPGSESDSYLLSTPPTVGKMVSSLRSLINTYCGANAPNVQVMVTETNSVSYNPGKQTVSTVNALWAADSIMSWIESGASNVDIWNLHNGSYAGNCSSSLYGTATYGDYGILANATSGEPAANTPFPTYYGIQMLSHLGRPGDTTVTASSSNSLLDVHAVKQANGDLAVMLVNKDPSNTTNATISLSGYTAASGATTYTYGKLSSAISSGSITTSGSSFTVAALPYSLTTVVLTPGTAPSPDFGLTSSVSSLAITQGASGTSTIDVTPANGFTGSVSLSASGLPRGVTASFSPSSTTGTSTLTLTASSTATTGPATITITGVSGSLTHTATISLQVNATTTSTSTGADFSLASSISSATAAPGTKVTSTIRIVPSNGFTGSVSLGQSGCPSGVVAWFGTSPITTSTTLYVSVSSTAKPGNATITVTGISGSLKHTTSIALTIGSTTTTTTASPDFALSPSPSSVAVTQGSSASSTISVAPSNGFTGSVSLSASGLPSGVTASFSPSSTTGTSTLMLTASSTAATGTATITVTGVSGSLTHTTSISLQVNAPPNPTTSANADFALTSSVASATTAPGTRVTSTISVVPSNGFTGSVSLGQSGCPNGVVAWFGASPITGSTTLYVSVSSTAKPGTSTITVTGTSGSLKHTTSLVLTVN